MKLLTAIAFTAIVVALVASASAQRGGAARGGFSGHSAPSFHSSFAPSAHYSSGATSRYSRPSFAPATRIASAPRSSAVPSARSNFYSQRRPAIANRRRYVSGVGVPYAYPGFYGGYGDYDLLDLGYNDGGPYDQALTQPILYPDPNLQPEVEQQVAPAQPPRANSPRSARQPQPVPPQEDAVTLVFKDGRPSEQIHNYMLTRTMLYVRDQHRRDIPVDQLDLVATQKANQANGVEFALPSAK